MSRYMRLRALRIAVLVALWLAAVVLPTLQARAENLGPGGGTRVVVGDELVGPYRLWVTTSPEPAQVGVVTIVVRITDPSTGKKVTDATVAVELRSTEDGTRLTGEATHRNAGDSIDYAAHMQVPTAGAWNATMDIKGPLGPAQVTFTTRVLEPRSSSTLVMLGLPFLTLLLGLGGFWMWRSGQRAPRTA